MNPPQEKAVPASIHRLRRGMAPAPDSDVVAAEAPLEIRVEGRSVAVVMRTPGEDRELAAGFLLTEGVIASSGDVFEISECPGASGGNVVDVLLRDPARFDPEKLTRHVFTSSSCGICGKTSIESAMAAFPKLNCQDDFRIDAELLFSLPEKQRAAQEIFAATGGLHATAIFDAAGECLLLREDVGRHNALDKALGAALLADRFPLDRHVLMLSGRVSFELMQKALAGRIPIVAAVGAPSSLAVDFARESGQTLAGFLRDGRCNLYSGEWRITRAC